MNRLILVGNGFDLAHGLKTSYKDFIFWYLADCIGKADRYGKFPHEDLLCRCTLGEYHFCIETLRNKSIEGCIKEYYENDTLKNHLSFSNKQYFDTILPSSNNRYESKRETKNYLFNAHIKSDFLCNVFKNCIDSSWVDIEIEYFESLKACRQENGPFDLEKVLELNIQFEYFKEKLQEYLSIQENRYKGDVNPELLNLINAKFEIEDFDTVIEYEILRKKLGQDHTIKEKIHHNVHILNFNYTNIANTYKNEIKGCFDRIELNHIHGELNNSKNPIIFGFGDEYDKEYLNFEEQHNNAIFKHIKSYQYFKTPNYRNLVRFLNNDEYQVFVMGHSCGLSDRTMFKEIFEHDNCKSVKIFHYTKPDRTNDFEEKTINLGRHFSKKGQMRKLIVEFDEANAFPQI